MNEHRIHRGRRRDDEFNVVEQQIKSLGGSIGAGKRHRDRLLRSAADSIERTHHQSRSVKLLFVLSLGLILVSPLVGGLTRFKAPLPPTAEWTNAAALRRAEASSLSFDWALVDLFSQFRERMHQKH